MEDMTVYSGAAALSTDASTVAYCSFVPQNMEERKRLFNAVTVPDARLADMVGETIAIQDVYAENVKVNAEDGSVNDAVRTVIITPDGKSYTCVSTGIFNSIQKLFMMCGQPSEWEEPILVKVKQVNRGSRRILSLSIA